MEGFVVKLCMFLFVLEIGTGHENNFAPSHQLQVVKLRDVWRNENSGQKNGCAPSSTEVGIRRHNYSEGSLNGRGNMGKCGFIGGGGGVKGGSSSSFCGVGNLGSLKKRKEGVEYFGEKHSGENRGELLNFGLVNMQLKKIFSQLNMKARSHKDPMELWKEAAARNVTEILNPAEKHLSYDNFPTFVTYTNSTKDIENSEHIEEGVYYSLPKKKAETSEKKGQLSEKGGLSEKGSGESEDEEESESEGDDERLAVLKQHSSGKDEDLKLVIQAPEWNPEKDPLLLIEDLHVSAIEDDQPILKGVNLRIKANEIHAIMGRNGSGKSTLSKVIAAHPNYKITKGKMFYKNLDLTVMAPEHRALAGIFLAFQYPIDIPMVKNSEFLRIAMNEKRKMFNLKEIDSLEFTILLSDYLKNVGLRNEFLNRPVNYGFSGGEKKRNEILQMLLLDPILCMLDETDSGLDFDSFKLTAKAVTDFRTRTVSPLFDFTGDDIFGESDKGGILAADEHEEVKETKNFCPIEHGRTKKAFLIVTHYNKLLDLLKPDYVHVMHNGQIVKTGDISLALDLQTSGFAQFDHNV